jgi:hypothetical protein
VLPNVARWLSTASANDVAAFGHALAKTVARARAVTFAERPTGIFAELERAVVAHPTLSLITPFPRFMGSAFNFVSNHLGLPILRQFAPAPLQRLSEPELRRVLAQAATGSILLSAGMALDQLGVAGDRPSELRIGDNIFDFKPFFPLFFWMQIGRLLRRPDIGDAEVRDLAESFIGQGRFVDSVPLGVQLAFGKGDIEGARDAIAEVVGDILGSFTVPLRPLRTVLEDIFDKEKSIDTRISLGTRIWGPIAANVPFAGQLTDDLGIIVPTSGRDIAETDPVKFGSTTIPAGLFRTLSGVSPVTRDKVASLLLRLDVDPFQVAPRIPLAERPSERLPGAETAARRLNQAIRVQMGPLVAALVAPQVPWLEQLANKDPEAARVLLTGFVSQARNIATTQAEAMFSPSELMLIRASAPARTFGGLAVARVLRAQLAGAAAFGEGEGEGEL